MKPILALLVVLLFLAACNAPETPAETSTFPLKEYVMAEEEAWEMEALDLQTDGDYAIPVTKPESGFKAALLEVVFNPDSDFPLTFTSGTVVTPDIYPFESFKPTLPN